jgi:hypothetical protein
MSGAGAHPPRSGSAGVAITLPPHAGAGANKPPRFAYEIFLALIRVLAGLMAATALRAIRFGAVLTITAAVLLARFDRAVAIRIGAFLFRRVHRREIPYPVVPFQANRK